MAYNTNILRHPTVAIELLEAIRTATQLRCYPLNQKSGIHWLRVEVKVRQKVPATAGE